MSAKPVSVVLSGNGQSFLWFPQKRQEDPHAYTFTCVARCQLFPTKIIMYTSSRAISSPEEGERLERVWGNPAGDDYRGRGMASGSPASRAHRAPGTRHLHGVPAGHPGARARASGTHPRKANKPWGPRRAAASSGGTRNAFSYLSLCLELLPGMRRRPLPGDPVCTRVCVRARVCVCVCVSVCERSCWRCSSLTAPGAAPPPPPRHKEPPPSPLPAHPSPALPPASAPPPWPPRLPVSPPRGPYLSWGRGSPPWLPSEPTGQRRPARPPPGPARPPLRAPPPLSGQPLPPPLPPSLPPRSRLPAPEPELSPRSPNLPRLRSMPSAARRAGLGVGRGRAGRPVAASPQGEEWAPTGSGAQPREPGAEQPSQVVGSAKRRWVGHPGKPARGALLWGLPGGSPRHVPHAQGSGTHGMALGAEPRERGQKSGTLLVWETRSPPWAVWRGSGLARTGPPKPLARWGTCLFVYIRFHKPIQRLQCVLQCSKRFLLI